MKPEFASVTLFKLIAFNKIHHFLIIFIKLIINSIFSARFVCMIGYSAFQAISFLHSIIQVITFSCTLGI